MTEDYGDWSVDMLVVSVAVALEDRDPGHPWSWAAEWYGAHFPLPLLEAAVHAAVEPVTRSPVNFPVVWVLVNARDFARRRMPVSAEAQETVATPVDASVIEAIEAIYGDPGLTF